VTVIRGYQVPGTTNGAAAVRCVYLTNGAVLVGFTLSNGATFSYEDPPGPLDHQTHEEISGGGVWCESTNAFVSNCVLTGNSAIYGGAAFSGTLSHCTLTGNSGNTGGAAIRSVVSHSVLAGNAAQRYGGAADHATLNDCIVTDNSALLVGGGVTRSTLNRCVINTNSASIGGGSAGSTLNNCVLAGNSATNGGGAYGGRLANCTIVGNSGGGVSSPFHQSGEAPGCDTSGCAPYPECHGCILAFSIILNNCIVYHNGGANYPDVPPPGFFFDVRLDYCSTTPLPLTGVGNITNAPLFVDAAAANFHLQSNSPCINAGRNIDAPAGPDLEGNPRIVGGTADIGAYEFQSPQSVISYAWLEQNGLPIDGSADFADTDGDGANNFDEWNSGTNPTNSLSALRMLTPLINSNALVIRWQSVAGQMYFIERSLSLSARPAFVETIATNIVGQAGTTTFTVTNGPGTGPFFYRIRVNGNFHPCPNAVFGELCGFGG
jgi:hypothetical protein